MISLSYDDGVFVKRTPFSWNRVSVENIDLPPGETIEYSWLGTRHYIALHNIALLDGAIQVDGNEVKKPLDSRGLLTFIPGGCKVTGWGNIAKIESSITTLFYDNDLVESELEIRLNTGQRRPVLYFDDSALRGTLLKLQELVETADASSELYAETLGLLAAIELDRGHHFLVSHVARSSGALPPHIERLLRDYIEENMGRTILLSDLADIAKMSRFHMLRAFKRSFGITPNRYVAERRMEKAKTLLSTTHIPITSISKLCGFSADEYFSATFRKMTGTTPTQFRRLIGPLRR